MARPRAASVVVLACREYLGTKPTAIEEDLVARACTIIISAKELDGDDDKRWLADYFDTSSTSTALPASERRLAVFRALENEQLGRVSTPCKATLYEHFPVTLRKRCLMIGFAPPPSSIWRKAHIAPPPPAPPRAFAEQPLTIDQVIDATVAAVLGGPLLPAHAPIMRARVRAQLGLSSFLNGFN